MPDVVLRALTENMSQALCPLDPVRSQTIVVWILRLLTVSNHVDRWVGLGQCDAETKAQS